MMESVAAPFVRDGTLIDINRESHNMTKQGPTGTLSNQVGSLMRHTVNPGVIADWLGHEC